MCHIAFPLPCSSLVPCLCHVAAGAEDPAARAGGSGVKETRIYTQGIYTHYNLKLHNLICVQNAFGPEASDTASD